MLLPARPRRKQRVIEFTPFGSFLRQSRPRMVLGTQSLERRPRGRRFSVPPYHLPLSPAKRRSSKSRRSSCLRKLHLHCFDRVQFGNGSCGASRVKNRRPAKALTAGQHVLGCTIETLWCRLGRASFFCVAGRASVFGAREASVPSQSSKPSSIDFTPGHSRSGISRI